MHVSQRENACATRAGNKNPRENKRTRDIERHRGRVVVGYILPFFPYLARRVLTWSSRRPVAASTPKLAKTLPVGFAKASSMMSEGGKRCVCVGKSSVAGRKADRQDTYTSCTRSPPLSAAGVEVLAEGELPYWRAAGSLRSRDMGGFQEEGKGGKKKEGEE